jgi:hypothetical protein
MQWTSHLVYGLLYVLIPILIVSLAMYTRYMHLYEKSVTRKERDIETSDLIEVDVVKYERDPSLKKKSLAAKTVSTITFILIAILFAICLICKY